jgi:hypothetical protein
MFCFISIVKRGHLLLPIFGFPTKKYKKIQKKHIKRNPKNNRSEKRIARMPKKCQNWLRRFKNAKG